MPKITTAPYRDNGRNVYADGALLGWYWPDEAPKPWDDTARADAGCEPGIHAERPIHAFPLFSTGPATHHATPEEAIDELIRARERPDREQIEVVDGCPPRPSDGVAEAVRYARQVVERLRAG